MIELAPLHRRRHASRRMARLPCAAIRFRDFRTVAEGILDLSPTGALLRTDADLRIGDELLVSFVVPGESEYVDAPAVVVRRIRGVRKGDRGRGVGVRFRGLHPTEIARLQSGLSRIPPVIPARRREVDYAAAVQAIAASR